VGTSIAEGGVLRVGDTIYPLERYLVLPNSTACAWAATFGAAAVISVVYFVAAWLGLVLRPEPAHTAVFWPASGIAIGILIIAGRRASLAVCMSVMVGGVAATIFGGRGLFRSALLSGCNLGEVILFFWFLSRWVGGPFAFRDVREVVGFLLAASIAAATSGVGGAAILASSVTPYLVAWETWLPSHVVGIVVVAPLLFALDQLRRHPPSRGETAEALAGLVILVLASLYAWSQPAKSWLTFSSTIITLPPLLWLAARCQPAFAIAGASISSSAVICLTIFGIGRFGDEAVSITDRVHGAQTILMMVMVSTLVLTALFAALKRSNELLRSKEAGFRQLLEALPAAIQTTDTAGRITYCNQAAVDLWGVRPEVGRDTLHSLYRLYYQDGTPISDLDDLLRASCAGAKPRGQELILERTDGKRIPIISSPSPLSDEAGGVVGAVQMYLDISERKRAEQALAERNAQFELAQKAARVGCYTYDISAQTMRFSRGSAASKDVSESILEVTADQWRARVHRDDFERLRTQHIRAFKEKRREIVDEFRFVRPGGEVRWKEVRSLIAYDHAGRAERMTGVFIDITDRRKAEDQKSLLIAELDHRVKNVLACVAAVAQRSRECSSSADGFLEVLNGRINSLANTHALLSRSHWEGVDLGELVRSELAFCANDETALIKGPVVGLAPEATQPLAMVLHELATNAAKYGALSNGSGRVLVRWRRQPNGGSVRKLVLEWRETGGPPVTASNASGFGTSVIRDLIPYELGGAVEYELAREGCRCRLEIPSEWLSTFTRARSTLNRVDHPSRAVS
jgi:PAS domain S-box-containing protein